MSAEWIQATTDIVQSVAIIVLAVTILTIKLLDRRPR